MSFSVHLSDELVEQLNQTARECGKARNAIEVDADQPFRSWIL